MLAGSAVVGMHVCHATLRGLTMHLKRPNRNSWAAAPHLEVQLTSQRSTPRYGIGLAVRWTSTHAETTGPGPMCPHRAQAVVQVAFQPRGEACTPARPDGRDALSAGHLPRVDRLAAGRPGAGVPGARGHPAAPASGRAPRRRRGHAHAARHGEFDGVRAYRRGRPAEAGGLEARPRAQAAGSDDLVSRDTQQAHRQELWLDFAHGPARPGTEPACRACAPGCCRPTGWAWTTACACRGEKCQARQRRRRTAAPSAWRHLAPVLSICGVTAAFPALRSSQLALPRDARDTLFLLAVIAWVMHAAGAQPACGAPPARGWGAGVARVAGLARRPLPGRWWLVGLLVVWRWRARFSPTAPLWGAKPG
jgi:hypothetical protein